MKLKRLTVEAFRGFRDRATFDLDASAILLQGSNGTGKTSLFDALQWVLIGSLKRLEPLRARKNTEHIVNVYRAADSAEVVLDVCTTGGEVTIRRRGNYRGNTLEVLRLDSEPLFGDEAEAWLSHQLVPDQTLPLATALHTFGLLQQDIMRSFLEAKSANRYAYISSILGLADLEWFEKDALAAFKEATRRRDIAHGRFNAARDALDLASSGLETEIRKAATITSVSVATEDIAVIAQNAPRYIYIQLPDSPTVDNAVSLVRQSRGLSRNINRLADASLRLHQKRKDLLPLPSPDQMEKLTRLLNESEKALQQVQVEQRHYHERLDAAERSSAESERLAAVAVPLLSNRCPVCGQSIDQQALEARLRHTGKDTSRILELRASLMSVNDTLTKLTAHRQGLKVKLADAINLANEWKNLQEDQKRLQLDVATLENNMPSPFFGKGLAVVVLSGDASEVISFLDALAMAFERYADVVTTSLEASRVDQIRGRVAGATTALEEEKVYYDKAVLRNSRLKHLAEAATVAHVEVTRSRFEMIVPLVLDIFSRLDPHPTFKMIGFEHDVRFRRGESRPIVGDPDRGVQADPLMVFSASQANIAALSYFLAMGYAAGDSALPFVLLDDPLQSMDDVNVLGFAELCRFLRSNRQLILSTHDPRFANLLSRKLSPRMHEDRTILYSFDGWDRRGPWVEAEYVEYTPEGSRLRVLGKPA